MTNSTLYTDAVHQIDAEGNVSVPHYQPNVGESVSDFRLCWTHGDHWIIRHGEKFYVAILTRHKYQGGDIPHALIESWACETLDDAIERYESMTDAKAKACDRFGCE